MGDGGVILVSHDSRLIQAIDCDIWVVNRTDPDFKPDTAQLFKHPRGFDGYRDDVLDELAAREQEIEDMARRRAAELDEKRKALGIAFEAKNQLEFEAKKERSSKPDEGGEEEGDEGDDSKKKGPRMTAKDRQLLKKEQERVR